jgi:hypothetical protein
MINLISNLELVNFLWTELKTGQYFFYLRIIKNCIIIQIIE